MILFVNFHGVEMPYSSRVCWSIACYSVQMRTLAASLLLLAVIGKAQSVSQVLNRLDSKAPLCPGSQFLILGRGFDIDGVNPAFSSLKVTVAGETATIVEIFSNLIEGYLPLDLPAGATTLTVSVKATSSKPFNVVIVPFAPEFIKALLFSGPFTSTDNNHVLPINDANPAWSGQTVIGYLIGLGMTNPIVAANNISIAPTAARPTVKIGSASAQVGFSNFVEGVYEVSFVVPPGLLPGDYDAVLTIGGVTSPASTLPVGIGAPGVVAIENSATGQLKDATHGAAPNSFITLYVSNLGTVASPANIFPATDFQEIEVFFDGKVTPLYNVTPSANLINVAVPSELSPNGTTTVSVKNALGIGPGFTLTLASVDLGLFVIPDPAVIVGLQNGAVQISNTAWDVMPASLAAKYGLQPCTGLPPTASCGQPAKPGDDITIYFTGGGLATPGGDPNGAPIPTGSVAPIDGSILYKMVQTPTVMIGAFSAPVSFAGITPGTAAEYQINTTIPSGMTSSDQVHIRVTLGSMFGDIAIAVQTP